MLLRMSVCSTVLYQVKNVTETKSAIFVEIYVCYFCLFALILINAYTIQQLRILMSFISVADSISLEKILVLKENYFPGEHNQVNIQKL